MSEWLIPFSLIRANVMLYNFKYINNMYIDYNSDRHKIINMNVF